MGLWQVGHGPGAPWWPGVAATALPSLSGPWFWPGRCRAWSHGWCPGTGHCTAPFSGCPTPSHTPQPPNFFQFSGHPSRPARNLAGAGILMETYTSALAAAGTGPPGPFGTLAPWADLLHFVFLSTTEVSSNRQRKARRRKPQFCVLFAGLLCSFTATLGLHC